MQKLKIALQQLVNGYPRQATSAIQIIMNTNQDFFSILTDLILGETTQQLSGKVLNGGLATFNTLSLRYKSQTTIKQYLTLDLIYQCLQKMLSSQSLSFENKKLLSPSMSQFLLNACSTHKQILDLKKFILKTKNHDCIFIVLDAICKTKNISKPIQIQCIVQLFEMAMSQFYIYNQILTIQFERPQVRLQVQNKSEIATISCIVNRIKFILNLIYQIFQNVLKQINQPYEYQAINYLSKNEHLAMMLIAIIQWKNPYQFQHKYKFIWFNDLKQSKNSTLLLEFYDINNLKQKCFLIISSILKKTNPEYNLQHCINPLMSHIPTLLYQVLYQLKTLSGNFYEYEKDYLIAPLADSMLLFLARCIKFTDLVVVIASNITQEQMISCLLLFLNLRDSDLNIEEDGDCFGDFLQGFAGHHNFNQVNRYAVAVLIKMCCVAFDSFPAQFFHTCLHNIIRQLQSRLKNINSQLRNIYTNTLNSQIIPKTLQGIPISCCLLGLISINEKLSRPDFKSLLTQFFLMLDLHSLKLDQINMIYYILANNLEFLQDQRMLNAIERYIKSAMNISIQPSSHQPTLLYQFVKTIYLNFIVCIPINHEHATKYIMVTDSTIWNELLKALSSQKGSRDQSFYNILHQIVNVERLTHDSNLKSNYQKALMKEKKEKQQIDSILRRPSLKKKSKLNIETVGDFLINKVSFFFYAILQKCCQIETKIIRKQKNQNSLIAFKLHQVIVQCLQSLFFINNLEGDPDLKIVQFRYYTVPPNLMIKIIMDIPQDPEPCSYEMSIQQVMNLMQILSTLINQERYLYPNSKPSCSLIPEQTFEALLPAMLQHPFGEPWLICICEFTHRVNGKFKINQTYQILELINESFKKYYTNQLKLNQLCLFIAVLLFYEQPQNWVNIQQTTRVEFIRLLKIQGLGVQRRNKVQKRKKMMQLGYESENIFGITVIRLFHVYLFGFKLEPANQLLSQILAYIQRFVQRYSIIQAAHLIISFKSSCRFFQRQNFDKLMDLIILILTKLLTDTNFYGSQTPQQQRIRKLSHKIGCIALDPYNQFRGLVQCLKDQGIDLVNNPIYGSGVKNLLSVNVFGGQPRKLYSIKK